MFHSGGSFMKKGFVAFLFVFCLAQIAANAQPLSVSSVSNDELCYGANNGDVVFSIVGTNPPFALNWIGGPANLGNTENYPAAGNTTLYTNLPPGTYDISVTDNLGVAFPFSFTILPVVSPLVVQVINPVNIGCGGTPGGGTADVTGGTAPYTYAWDNGGLTQTATSLTAGTHQVDVTDANSCPIASASVTITNNGGLNFSISSTPISCQGAADGTATLTVNNGVLPITYNWSTGDTGPTIINQGPTPPSTPVTCIATDNTGCSTPIQNFTFIDPSSMTVGISVTNVNCFGDNSGAAVAQVTGGTFPYSYLWGGGQTTNLITNQPIGPVSVTVTDAGGCSPPTVNAVITQPSQLAASIGSFSNATCFGYSDGQATVVANGGTPPYVCNWSNGLSGFALTTLPQGAVNATVVDANGCTAPPQVVVINEPAELAFTISNSVGGSGSFTDTICAGNSIDLTANPGAGVPAVTFTWDNGPTTATQTVSPNVTTTYQVTASDGVCQSQSHDITVIVHEILDLSVPANVATCSDVPFSLSALATGGDRNYTYTWDNGVGPGPGPFMVSTSVPTIINVTVTDGCNSTPVTKPINVTVNPNPTAFFTPDTTTGCLPVAITFTDSSYISTGIGSVVAWKWYLGEPDSSFDQYPFHLYETPGKYTISLIAISDQGCTDTLTVDSMISVYPYPVATFTESNEIVDMIDPVVTFSNNTIDATQYLWQIAGDSITDMSPTYTFKDTGTFSILLTATNEGQCSDQLMNRVTVRSFYAIYIPSTFTPHDPDLINDTFGPKGQGIREYEMKIYDRWGNRVFRTKNFEEPWDGTITDTGIEASQGNYIYDIFVRDANGKQRFYGGSIKLIK